MEEQFITLLDTLGYPVSWGELGQGTALPRIMLSQASGFDDIHLQGRSEWIAGRVQVDCYADTYAEAVAVRRAVIGLLSGYQGGPIMSARLMSIRDLPSVAGSDVIQRQSLDFAVEYRE